MQIDGFTLFVILLLHSWTGFVVIGYLWLANREIKGVPFWFLSFAFYALATPLAMSRAVLPMWLSIGLSNAAFYLSFLFFLVGHNSFLHEKHPVWLYIILTLFYLVGFNYYYFVDFDTNMRILLMAVLSEVAAIYVAFLYFSNWSKFGGKSYGIATILFLGSVLVILRHIYLQLTEPQTDLFKSYEGKPLLTIAGIWLQSLQVFVYYILINDIYKQKLTALASHDPLTDCLTPNSFIESAQRQLLRTKGQREPLSILLVDLDWFSNINQKYGYQAGDQVLVQVVKTIKKQGRPGDLLARLSGSQFCFLLDFRNQVDAYIIAQHILKNISNQMYRYKNHNINLTVSIGLVERTPAHQDISQLIDQAHIALKQSKDSGKNKISTFG